VTPHDSTRRGKFCERAIRLGVGVCQTDTCDKCPLKLPEFSPSEPVGAVDAEKAEQYAKYALESNLYAHQEHFPNLARAYLALREQVATLTRQHKETHAENAVVWGEVRKLEAALARATPEVGSQYATTAELYNDLANELDETRTTEDIARLTAAIHALDPKNPPPMPAEGEAVAWGIWHSNGDLVGLKRTKEEAEKWCGNSTTYGPPRPLYTTPPRSPATVTEEMVEAFAKAHTEMMQSEEGWPSWRDGIRAGLTAALGGRDAE
jgi:hypothetical protein